MPFDSLPVERPLTQADLDLAVLRRARCEVAKPRAWCQGTYSSDGGARCAAGWLMYLGHWRSAKATALLVRGLPRDDNEAPWTQVYNYNDTHTQKEVVALFDRAIASLEAERV